MTTSLRRRKNHPSGVLLVVVLVLAIAVFLLKSEKSRILWGQKQNPAASRGGKK